MSITRVHGSYFVVLGDYLVVHGNYLPVHGSHLMVLQMLPRQKTSHSFHLNSSKQTSINQFKFQESGKQLRGKVQVLCDHMMD